MKDKTGSSLNPSYLGRSHESVSLPSMDARRVIEEFTDDSGWNSWILSDKDPVLHQSAFSLEPLEG